MLTGTAVSTILRRLLPNELQFPVYCMRRLLTAIVAYSNLRFLRRSVCPVTLTSFSVPSPVHLQLPSNGPINVVLDLFPTR